MLLSGLRLLLELERRANFDPSQPRDAQGRWTDTGVSASVSADDPGAPPPGSSAAERIRVTGPFDWGPVDLRSEEGYEGGHTLFRHVGKTPEDLAARVAWESSRSDRVSRKGWRAGTFPSLASANDLVGRTLQANPAIVAVVGAGVLPNAPIRHNFVISTGFEAFLETKVGPVRFRETTGVLVYIVHDNYVLVGFRIHTAYPVSMD